MGLNSFFKGPCEPVISVFYRIYIIYIRNHTTYISRSIQPHPSKPFTCEDDSHYYRPHCKCFMSILYWHIHGLKTYDGIARVSKQTKNKNKKTGTNQ